MKKIILLIFIGFGVIKSFSQDMTIDNLKNFKWISETQINDFNIGNQKVIGISKLSTTVDSLKINLSVFTFTDDEIWIQSYKPDKGLDEKIIKCTYQYDEQKKEMKIFHWSQDSAFWEYSVGIVSSGNYIRMTKKEY